MFSIPRMLPTLPNANHLTDMYPYPSIIKKVQELPFSCMRVALIELLLNFTQLHTLTNRQSHLRLGHYEAKNNIVFHRNSDFIFWPSCRT